MSTLRRRFVALGATAIASSLVLAGCASSSDEADSSSTSSSGGSSSTDETFEGCDFYADYMFNEGTEVEIYTTIIDPEASLFIDSFGEFEECTGILAGISRAIIFSKRVMAEFFYRRTRRTLRD